MPSTLLLARYDTALISVRLGLELGNGHVNKYKKIWQALCPEVSTECRGDLKWEKAGLCGRDRESQRASIELSLEDEGL